MLVCASGFEADALSPTQPHRVGWYGRRRDKTLLLLAFGFNERGVREIIVSGRANMIETTYKNGQFGLDRILVDGSRETICAWRELP